MDEPRDPVIAKLHIDDHVDLSSFKLINKTYAGIHHISLRGSVFIESGKSVSDKKISEVGSHPKAVIEMMYGYYPFITSVLKTIVDFYSYDKNTDVELLIITRGETAESHFRTFEQFIFRYLKDHNIKYQIIALRRYIHEIGEVDYELEIGNFTLLTVSQAHLAPKCLYEPITEYIVDKESVASRKVFISRKLSGREESKFERRSINHQAVEGLFSELGFEIIDAENFTDFIDQINFFDKVSVLAGITGAGMANMVFMRPGSKVIQLINPVSFPHSDDNGRPLIKKELHLIYNTMSFFKDHKILNINNRFNPEELINDKDTVELIRRFAQ